MNNRRAERWFPLSNRSLRWGVIALAFSGYCDIAAAQLEDGQAPRRIAPQSFPEYRGRRSTETETRIALPTIDKPLGSCDDKLPRSTFLRCLRSTVDASDAAIEQMIDKARTGIEERAGVSLGQKQFWVRTLDQAQTSWKAYRNHECQFLAVFEKPGPQSADERLYCQLRFNRSRIDDLKQRYQVD
jgi:uncharacterized protein YecT (DUF1311 family)